MKQLQLLFILFFVAQQLAMAQFTDEINSNRPGKSMMAYSLGKSVFQAEMGGYYTNEKHDKLKYTATGFLTELDFRWGLFFEELELIAEFQYQNDNFVSDYLERNRSGLKKTLFGAKYLVYDPFKNYEEKVNLYSWKANRKFKWRQLIPAVAVYGGVHFNFSDNLFDFSPPEIEQPQIAPKFMLVAQNHFKGSWVLVTNIMYDKIGSDFSSIDYIITLTRGFNSQWSGFIENQGYNGNYYSDGVFRVGAAYLFHNNMQLDASISKNIKNTPTLFNAGIGFSWRFAKNYKEIRIEKDNGSKMDKKMKKKATKEDKKKNKRKDQVDFN